MSAHSDEDMDVPSDGLGAVEGSKLPPNDESGIRDGIRHLSVSPHRHRTSSPRSSTPPPVPLPPRVETPTPTNAPGMPRTLSSPSLMDASPKTKISRKKANELTPITRNTGTRYVDEGHVVISPDDGMDILHGEHLTNDVRFAEGQLKRAAAAPSLPPLRMSGRAKSMGTMQTRHSDDEDSGDEKGILMPVHFPSDRKYCHYSFTSQQQFRNSTSAVPPSIPSGLIPYQPTRGEDDNVGSFPGEALGGIFQDGIPLDERQYSIPSIHLAHHLNGSITSYTDEEDDLHRTWTFDDEASLSSRNSSLFLPGEDEEASASGVAKLRLNVSAAKVAFREQESSSEGTAPPKMTFPPLTHDSDNDADEEEENEENKKRVKKRTKRKEQQAIEWLRSVETTNDAISEAASSKFLTSKSQVPVNRRRSYHRNTSSPLEEQRSGAFPPPSDTFPPSTHQSSQD